MKRRDFYMKKRSKILASLLLALVMVFTLTSTAFAVDYTITAPDNGHTYEVYQIFTGDLYNNILSNVKWGKNGTGTEGEAVPDTILKELEETTGSDSAKLAVIAKYVTLGKNNKYGSVTSASPLENVPAGYYLIKDVDDALDGQDDAYTTYIVEIVDDVAIEPKSAKPSSEKKVTDTNDSTGDTSGWQDSADYDIGDMVPFQLKGTVASNYDNYTVYQFIFHDKESKGLTFDSSTVKVYVDGTEITEGFQVVTSDLSDNCTFEVRFSDLKTISSVHAGSVITVEYKSKLNDKAVLGSTGNPNTLHLEYSNNPNDKQGGDTGKTPEDKVIVFTYQTVINKVTKNPNYNPEEEGSEEYIPLTGAEFTLEKYNKEKDSWEAITVVQNGEGTTFTFSGLDDGLYRLTETKTPAGYNTIDPIYFEVTADHDVLSDNPTLTSLSASQTDDKGVELTSGMIATFAASSDKRSLTTDIVNNKGATLPETGGIGTTIFYVLGGALVIGAAILLITKKRMNAEK